ncbi:hypothetical protein [Nocardia arthritidis]|uniref:hypothetical protein n=1 Tax=Nocardia arthritidis TaxID=228602 RepID=UPI0007A374A2
MPEAVIASVARSPIGRESKASSRDLRPGDSGARIVRAALAKQIHDKQIGSETMRVGGGQGMAKALEGLS